MTTTRVGVCCFCHCSCTFSSIQTNCKQGNQRWQIPRPPHASAWQRSPHSNRKIGYFFRDVISLFARVIILLIDTATQEVPMKNI